MEISSIYRWPGKLQVSHYLSRVYVIDTNLTSQATLAGHSFLAVSHLSLAVEFRASQEQALRELLTSFPNVKKMSLRVVITSVSRILQASTGSLHDIVFHRLKSLRIQTEGALTSQDFISRQGSLLELHCNGQIWTLVTLAPKMKGLSIESSIEPLKAPQAGSFNSITILQLRREDF